MENKNLQLNSITYRDKTYIVGKSVWVIGDSPGGGLLVFESVIERIEIEDDDFNVIISQNNYMTNFQSYYILNQLIPITNRLLKNLKREFGFSETEACKIADSEKFYKIIKK